MKELRLSLSKYDNNICENDIMLIQNLYCFQYLKTNETFNPLAINVPIIQKQINCFNMQIN